MLNILICDDNREEAGKLRSLLDRYRDENGMLMSVNTASTQEEISAAVSEASKYDVLFLDIYMESKNGIEIAKALRAQNINIELIFFSTSLNHALDAFGVNALQYLVKPVSYEKLADAMKRIRTDKPKVIAVQADRQTVRMAVDEILYTECHRHYQYIHCRGAREIKTRMSVAELYEMFDGAANVIRVGVSYIVNLDYVEQITSKEILIRDGGRILMPRNSYAELKKAYFDYYRKGAGEL